MKLFCLTFGLRGERHEESLLDASAIPSALIVIYTGGGLGKLITALVHPYRLNWEYQRIVWYSR